MSIRTRQDSQDQNGQGAGTGTGDGDEGGLSEAQAKAVEGMVNTAVNGAITQHLTRFKKQFSEEIGTTVGKQLGDALGPVSEQLKRFTEVAATGAGAAGGGAAGAGAAGAAAGSLPPEFREQIARFEGRTKELEGQLAQERKAREEEKAARERDRQDAMAKEERGALAGALRAKGMPEAQVRAAVAMLAGEDKVLGRTDDNTVIFKLQKGTGAAKYVDEVPLDVGVDEWLKTEDGKSFLPARQAQGAGGLGSRQQLTGNKAQDAKIEATSTLGKILLGGGA